MADYREVLSKQARYRFYRDLGLAVRFENGVVSEIVIAQLPDETSQG